MLFVITIQGWDHESALKYIFCQYFMQLTKAGVRMLVPELSTNGFSNTKLLNRKVSIYLTDQLRCDVCMHALFS